MSSDGIGEKLTATKLRWLCVCALDIVKSIMIFEIQGLFNKWSLLISWTFFF